MHDIAVVKKAGRKTVVASENFENTAEISHVFVGLLPDCSGAALLLSGADSAVRFLDGAV